MTRRILLFFDFKDIFILILLNISNIEAKEDSNIDKLENFNINIQIYLTFKKKHKEFIIIKVNLNIVKNNNEKHLYNKDDFYFESKNVRYNNII